MPSKYLVVLSILVLAASAFLVSAAPARPPAGGTITGKVNYTGTPPKMRPIDMSKEPYCQKQHNPPIKTQDVESGPGDTLKDVVVYISVGDKGSAPASTPVRFDQKGCEYTPHILTMEADQPLQIYTNDPVAHNIHPMPKLNSEWNKSQPPGAPPIDTKWDKPEFIPVKCNIHPWMHGYFVVLKTSHYGVTGEDGNYEIKDVPPGKYTLTAWQEHMGSLTQEVTVSAGETKANFTFHALPY
ncbi:MAG: carboxypeptidase regulatory-like domain-containing protein [Candidatus Acidiferrales bacterium]